MRTKVDWHKKTGTKGAWYHNSLKCSHNCQKQVNLLVNPNI